MKSDQGGVTLDNDFEIPRHRGLMTCGLSVAAALQAADALIANVALPQLQQDLGGGLEVGVWVITSYLCATAVAAPLTGRLRRQFGSRRLFFLAMTEFIAGSLLCAVAPSSGAIILFRVVQGIGGGILHPLSQAILLDLYPKDRHGRMLAVWGAALMAGPILGPVIGGVIADYASWRWVFVVNLPLGCLAGCCLLPLPRADRARSREAIDPLGIVVLMLGVAALQLALQRAPGHGWFHSPEVIAETLTAGLAVALVIGRARSSGFTVFRLEIFKDLNFSTAAFFNFMNSGLLFVAVVFIPLLAQGPLGLPATVAGALIVPRAVLLMLVMLFTGRLVGHLSDRLLLATGWVFSGAGLFILSMISSRDAYAQVIVGSLVQSFGAGILYIPLATLAYSTLPPDIRTDATGLYSLLRQLGYASGVALMSAILQARTLSHLGDTAGLAGANAASLPAYGDCFRMMALVSIGIIPGIFIFRLPLRQRRAA